MFNKKNNDDIPADLLKLRKRFDNVDKQIITLLAERKKLSHEAHAIKKKNNIEIIDRTRESEAIELRNSIALDKRVDPNFIKDVFTVIVMNSRRLQHEN
jgi:chorismate mutase